jgi:hypothetical protein
VSSSSDRDPKPSGYCRFCGSADLVRVEYEAVAGDPSVAIGVTGPQGVGANISRSPRSQRTVHYPTRYCRTCREIDATCTYAPIEAVVTVRGVVIPFFLPHELVVFLTSLGTTGDEIESAIGSLAGSAARAMKKMAARGGEIPCESRRAGFKTKMRVRGMVVRVFLIPCDAHGSSARYGIRVAYGGGNAQCP